MTDTYQENVQTINVRKFFFKICEILNIVFTIADNYDTLTLVQKITNL